jgi:DNA-binding transcriptional MerR regulator
MYNCGVNPIVNDSGAAGTADGPMLIAQFAAKSGLSVDTVRFYIRKRLLKPTTSSMGGSRPYQLFHARHLEIVETIRIAQALGLALDEIAALVEERRLGRFTRERTARFLRERRAALKERHLRLGGLLAFLDAKIAWLSDGKREEPRIDSFLKDVP